MRESSKTTRTCAIALLAVLCSGGAPVTADEPDTPPTTGVAADLPPIATAPAEASGEASAEPLATGWSSPADAEALLVTAQVDPRALGPLSIGTPDAGLLLNPVPFSPGPFWTVRDPSEAWATEETIDFLVTAIEAVEGRYPGSPRLVIGDLSNPKGGKLNRHRSHQAGRDADIGFYFQRGEVGSFLAARKKDLDLPRTWALVRALVTDTDVERIFVDRSLIAVFYQQALAEGEDPSWLDDIFGRTSEKGIIQHERRHKDHLHVRFYNPRAQEHGRIVYPVLVETGAAPPPMVKHRVRRGETLGSLALRYGTSVSAIRAANGLRSSLLRAGRSYTIPIRRTPPDSGPVVVPPRRLPLEMQARAVAEAHTGTAGADAPAAEQR
jgi:penicillin-insensitive murein endopeptidase